MKRIGVFLVLFVVALSAGCPVQSPEAKKPSDQPNSSANRTTARVFSIVSGNSSFLYIQEGANAPRRLTVRKSGWESDGVLSPKGDAVAYALADGPEAKSEVWVSTTDGSNPHRVSASEDDAISPAFGPDGKFLLYAKSRFNGHYSPIARPRRHKFDVVKVMVDPQGPVPGAVPVELTQQEFFDLRSLAVSPDGESFMVSTTGYPIGSLIEEFKIAKPYQIWKMFQPHVSDEPSTGPAYGEAAYTPDGMGIVFTAASQSKGRNFDYNLYQMNEVTGGDLVQLTHRFGMIDDMDVEGDGTIFFTDEGQRYLFDPKTQALHPD